MGRITWNEAMITNSAFILWARKKYHKKFIMPDEIERYRKKLGLIPRPKRFKV